MSSNAPDAVSPFLSEVVGKVLREADCFTPLLCALEAVLNELLDGLANDGLTAVQMEQVPAVELARAALLLAKGVAK